MTAKERLDLLNSILKTTSSFTIQVNDAQMIAEGLTIPLSALIREAVQDVNSELEEAENDT